LDLVKSSEALLNEYKGNLFEFLVALDLSKRYSLLSEFYDSISGDFHSMLSQQEEFIRSYYPHLVIELPRMAKDLADKIAQKIPKDISLIELVGKSAASNKDVGEADIICRNKEKSFYLSIKLSKENAYVNTKSAGIKSFISKYFSSFTQSQEDQEVLSSYFDQRFEMFSRDLHDQCDIDYDSHFNSWTLEAMPRLPGALKGKSREIYLAFIYDINNMIFDLLNKYAQYDSKGFIASLFPLMGQSRSDIISAIVFYKSKNKDLSFQSHVFTSYIESSDGLVLKNNKETSSFEINLNSVHIQIRLKCMNKFTSKSFKVNCAVKHL
jgi:hypothetical protein